MKHSLFMAAMVVRGFSWRSRESGREKARELREKSLVANSHLKPTRAALARRGRARAVPPLCTE